MATVLIHNATVADGSRRVRAWLQIDGERIAEIGPGDVPPRVLSASDSVVDAGGALMLPGMIDSHVHFRQPGLTHKADIAGESLAAVAGGVTTFFDMPNTVPPTLKVSDVRTKESIADGASAANYAFFIGASAENADELRACTFENIPGVKLFMGSSTGRMAVTASEALKSLFTLCRDVPLMVHAEDDAVIARAAERLRREWPDGDIPVTAHPAIRTSEACLSSARHAVELAERYDTRLHLAHVSTADEVRELLSEGPLDGKRITAEATPLHLTFAGPEDYESLGARIKVNPAVKSAYDRSVLRDALYSGAIDTIGTDHAPHLPAEKEGGALTASSGAPMVQFALPLLLSYFPAELVVEKMSANPARLFGVADRGALRRGNYADIVLVEQTEPYSVDDSMVISRCGWTPLAGSGYRLKYRVLKTWVNGVLAYSDGQPTGARAGRLVDFRR